MKRTGLLNPQLSAAVARLGHTDTFVVADCGLPIPADVPVIDLSVVFGTPRLMDVLNAILAEVVVEGAIIATEAKGTSIGLAMAEAVGLAPLFIDHERLKQAVARASFVVRTGENTPYANIVLHSGVPF